MIFGRSVKYIILKKELELLSKKLKSLCSKPFGESSSPIMFVI